MTSEKCWIQRPVDRDDMGVDDLLFSRMFDKVLYPGPLNGQVLAREVAGKWYCFVVGCSLIGVEEGIHFRATIPTNSQLITQNIARLGVDIGV